MNELIRIENKDGKPVVSSRVVAEDFGKQHKNVLQAINGLSSELSTSEFSDLFIESEYKASNGKMNKEYLLTRDGFSLLVMGFTGSEALKWKLKYINAFSMMEEQLKTIAIQSPQVFVDSLDLTEDCIKKYLPSFLNWKNVDEVIPLLIQRVGASVESGEVKIGVLNAVIKVSKQVRELCKLSAEKEIMTCYIDEAQAKYDRVLIASNAARAKANKDLKNKLVEKEKEIKQAENKRLCTFSKKALTNAFKEVGIINDLVNDVVNDVLVSDEKSTFKANLHENVKLIVENSNLGWDEAYTAVYNAMGLFKRPDTYKAMVDYIWDQQWEDRCLDAAVKVRERYGC